MFTRGVAERRAHRVEVAHGDARRVELRAGQGVSAGSRLPACAVPPAGSRRRRAHRRATAVGRDRVAGAALVHEHEVALATDPGEGAEHRRETRGSNPWPGPPAMRKSGSGFALVAIAGTTATASGILVPAGSSGSSGTWNVPQRASVETRPSRSAMRQGTSGIRGFASSACGRTRRERGEEPGAAKVQSLMCQLSPERGSKRTFTAAASAPDALRGR